MIALDSTGIKVANRGEWMRHKWHVRKGYLKIHVAVDIKKKRILSLEVASEEVHDGKMLKKLIDNASGSNHIKSVLAVMVCTTTIRISNIYQRTILNLV